MVWYNKIVRGVIMLFNKLKKCLSMILIVLIIFSFSACGKNKYDDTSSLVIGSENKISVIGIEENDIEDPENLDIITEEGAKVTTKELVKKTGKANGIDVSKWQGKIDWQRVKNSGVDFAIIRVGYRGEDGKIYKDSYADYNIQQADKAGVLVGVYFFSTAVNREEAIEEAKWLVSEIEGYSISYPVVYNSEGFLNESSRMNGLSKTQRTDNAVEFLNYVESNGYEGMFYAAKTELENSKYWDTAKLENSFMIWVARYPSVPYPKTETPDYIGKYDMWQYTDKGAVDGIFGNTDMVVSYFTREKEKPKNSEIKYETAQVPKIEDEKYTVANDEVTAKIEVNLRKDATIKSDIVGKLKNGTFLKRISTGSNGWSKLEYNGQTVYAITSYLTTDKGYKPPESQPEKTDDGFNASSGQVTAKDTTYLRSEPSENCTLVETIKNGVFVERIAVSPKGLTRLLYNGQTVYAKTSLLTTDIKAESQTSQVTTDKFTSKSGRVTAKTETNLRTGTTTVGTEVVYTLKKGEFVEITGEYNGWARINYNGQTVYAISSYLMTEEEYNSQEQQ